MKLIQMTAGVLLAAGVRGFVPQRQLAKHKAFYTSSSCLGAKKDLLSVNQGSFWRARGGDGCWRPTVSDVERISWGKPAKRKGTGSRGVPHRLNEDERFLFDQARRKGFLEVTGSAWRSQRRDAPLVNTYRSLCDARAQAVIVLHKGSTGIDELVIDLSPLRLPDTFDDIAAACLNEQLGGEVVMGMGAISDRLGEQRLGAPEEDVDEEDHVEIVSGDDDWGTRPIYQLLPYMISWQLPRADAKDLGKRMAKLFKTEEGKKGRSKKPVGVKPGKSRRHGGYGIG